MQDKIRKMFWRFALVMGIVSLLLGISDYPAFAVSEGPLPEPIVTGQSVEICLNSRDSEGTLNPGAVTDQQISNILWGTGKVPLIGSYRTIYLTTTTGTYLYHPDTHSLSWYSGDKITGEGAFKISWESELLFDAGLIYMPALLGSVSLWDSTESPVASRPIQNDIVFGTEQSVHGLDSTLVAICSVPESDPGYLPAPSTNGANSFEEVLADLNYTDNFTETNLTLQQISQLLWAGYGCTPHTGTGGKYALTVPSAAANYYLTKRIYLVNENGVYRYHNRLPPGDDLYTRDHRLEQIVYSDVRESLQSEVSGLPDAPCYVILCLDENQVGNWYVDPEPSFVAFNMLMQATALDLGAHFKPELTSSEQTNVRNIANIPSSHIPQVIVSIGTSIDELPDTSVTVKPAEFILKDLSVAPQKVEMGETVTVKVLLTNTGKTQGTYDVILKIDGTEVRKESITLEGGASQTVTFETSITTAGTYEVMVGDLICPLTVTAPESGTAQEMLPDYVISNLRIDPLAVTTNERVTISVEVYNKGGRGSSTVRLIVNGVEKDTREFTLDAKARRTVEFKVSQDTAGTYDVEINGLKGSFEVMQPSGVTNWPLIWGIIAASLVILVVVFLLIRKSASRAR